MKTFCLVVQGVYDIDHRVRRKAEALVEAGSSVDVLALRAADGQKCYSLNGVNVRTISLGKKRGSLARYAFEYVAFFVWALLRLTIQTPSRRYAVIDVNTLPDFLIFAAAPAKCLGTKVVLDMHEITPEFYRSKYGVPENSFWIRFLKYLEKISFRFADHVITINEPIQDLLVGRGLDRATSTVIMNSVDESRFAAGASTSLAPQTVREDHRFVMIYHGTLTRLYGLDIAVEAFALVKEEMPGAELWIVGSGTEMPALVRLAKERGIAAQVKLIGQVPSTEIPEWLAKADVGILPIRRDVFLDFAFPNKLPEFIVANKPVIVSRLRGIQTYFSENALAYCEPNDPASLSQQMLRLYRSPELRAALCVRAGQEYGPIRWSVMKERYLQLMHRLIDTQDGTVQQARVSAAR